MRPPAPSVRLMTVLGSLLALVLTLLALSSAASPAAFPPKDQPLEFQRAAKATVAYVNYGSRSRSTSAATKAALDALFAQRARGYRFGAVGTCRLKSTHFSCPSAILRSGNRVGTAYLRVYGSASDARVRSVAFSWR